MADIKQMVDSKISSKKLVVFSKGGCQYCIRAKEILKEFIGKKGFLSASDREFNEIGKDPKCNLIQAYFKTTTGASSVPRVFIGGKCIGGLSELDKLYKNRKLDQMLAK